MTLEIEFETVSKDIFIPLGEKSVRQSV